jgi:hypothetical protein
VSPAQDLTGAFLREPRGLISVSSFVLTSAQLLCHVFLVELYLGKL